jgi:hypothetical protein
MLLSASGHISTAKIQEANAISNAIGCEKHDSRSHNAVIRVYDAAGNVIEAHEHKGDFKEWCHRRIFRRW